MVASNRLSKLMAPKLARLFYRTIACAIAWAGERGIEARKSDLENPQSKGDFGLIGESLKVKT